MLNLKSDEPTLRDELSRGTLVERVGNQIARCEMPHVFGVHGDWGAGKTSFLHQVQLYLTGVCPQQPNVVDVDAANLIFTKTGKYKETVTVVWFEAWRYQHESAPVVALLHEIRSQLSWSAQLRRESAKLGEVAVRSALLAMEDLTKKIFVQASKIQETGEKWEKENLAAALPSHVIRQHLQKEIAILLGDKKGSRLVVIVDDLDRCASDAAYRLLEGIKIYLNLPSCVFVLGMNQKVIEDAITAHLPKSEGTGGETARILRAREYLEKLCQTIVHLPLLREPHKLLEAYLEGLKERDRIVKVVSAANPLPANPRKIKAFANIVRRSDDGLARIVARKTKDGKDVDRAVKVFVYIAALYYFHPDLYRVLEANPRFAVDIGRWASGATTTHGILSRLSLPRKPTGAITPGVDPTFTEMFLDPGDPTTFWLHNMARELEDLTVREVEETNEVL